MWTLEDHFIFSQNKKIRIEMLRVLKDYFKICNHFEDYFKICNHFKISLSSKKKRNNLAELDRV